MVHTGGCHCHNIHLRVTLTITPQESPLRACACTFCRAHAARYVADTGGLAEILADDWPLVEHYRFASGTADFLICKRCGVYVGAVGDTAAGRRAVINVNALDDRDAFTQVPATHDFDGEATEARLARRAARWMPAVIDLDWRPDGHGSPE